VPVVTSFWFSGHTKYISIKNSLKTVCLSCALQNTKGLLFYSKWVSTLSLLILHGRVQTLLLAVNRLVKDRKLTKISNGQKVIHSLECTLSRQSRLYWLSAPALGLAWQVMACFSRLALALMIPFLVVFPSKREAFAPAVGKSIGWWRRLLYWY
jgi:hypothetical protein